MLYGIIGMQFILGIIKKGVPMKKALNGQKILKIFDYFKEAFRLNTSHKELYRPQITYLILRGILLLLTGLSFLEITEALLPFIGQVSVMKFFQLFWNAFKGTSLLLVATTLLVMIFGSTYVEAGLYVMYDKINRGDDDDIVFTTGANHYFFSFLLGNVIIILFWLLLLVPYVIVGALTLTLGFVWVPIIVSALLMVWKASIVTDDVSTIEAMSKSISFGKKHFIPANVFIIIQMALSKATSGSSSGNTSSFQNSFNASDTGIENLPFETPGIGPDTTLENMIDQSYISTAIAIGTAVISVISIVVGMIHMIFEIFFALTTLIIYQDDWAVELPIDLTQATPDSQEPLEVE